MSDTRALEMGLVCPLPCAYRLGSILPWPPQLPGIDNWSHGDKPTIVAYLYAIGERTFAAERKVEALEARVRDLDPRTVGSAKF